MDPAFPRAGQDAWFFSSQFWEKCEVSFNGSYNDLSTAKESSFQSFLSLQADLLQEPALIAEIRLLCKKPSPAPWGLHCEVCRNEEQKEDPLVQSDSEKERKHDLSSPNYGSEHRDPRPGAWSLPPRLFSSLMWNNPLSVIAGLWVS